MPRDSDKNNDSPRGRRDRPSGGKGRSGAARGPDKKLAKRGFAGKSEGERRPYAGRSDGDKRPYAGEPDGAKSYGKKPYSGPGKPYAGKREGPPPRRDFTDKPRREFADRPRREEGDATRPARFNRDDRGPRKDFRPSDDRGAEKRTSTPRGERNDTRPAPRFTDRKSGDKRPYAPRGEGFRKDSHRPQGERPERKSGGARKFSRGAPDRAPRKEFGSRPDRGESKPWRQRDASSPDHAGTPRPPRDGARH